MTPDNGTELDIEREPEAIAEHPVGDAKKDWDDVKSVRYLKRALLHFENRAKDDKKAIIAETLSNAPGAFLAALYGENGHIIATAAGTALTATIIYKLHQRQQNLNAVLKMWAGYRKGDKDADEQDNIDHAKHRNVERLEQYLHHHRKMLIDVKNWELKNFKTSRFDEKAKDRNLWDAADLDLQTLKEASEHLQNLAQNTSRLKKLALNITAPVRILSDSIRNVSIYLNAKIKHPAEGSTLREDYKSAAKIVSREAGEAMDHALETIFIKWLPGEDTYRNIGAGFKAMAYDRPVQKFDYRRKFRLAARTAPANDGTALYHGKEFFKSIYDIYLSKKFELAKLAPEIIANSSTNKGRLNEIKLLQDTARSKVTASWFSLGQHGTETVFVGGHVFETFNAAMHGHLGLSIVSGLSSLVALEPYAYFGKNTENAVQAQMKAREDLLTLYKERHPEDKPQAAA